MLLTSKLKTIFSPELLRFIAAICDTKRIESNLKKMIELANLLYTYHIKFEILGGATNRLALQIDGYAFKFAMDEQGYKDNWMEYSLSEELQPYVTRSYETNGYILVAERVDVMTKETFQTYRYEISKVLDQLCQDYLLGDVGYIKKNLTNWGLRNNKPVILDYAYCHRATENLFTCSRCGSPLTYDSSYDLLICTDRSGCKATYTYNDRKQIQGDQVDTDMIVEMKANSVCMGKDEVSKDIQTFEDRLMGENYFIIDNPGDLYRYNKLKEEKLMTINMNGDGTMVDMRDKLSAMIDLANNPNDEEAKKILYGQYGEFEQDDNGPEAIYTDNYQENYMNGPFVGLRPLPIVEEEEENYQDQADGLSALIDKMNADKKAEESHRQAFNQKQDNHEQQRIQQMYSKKPEHAKQPESQEPEKKESYPISNQEENDTVYKDPDAIPLTLGDQVNTTSGTSGIYINGEPINNQDEVTVNE